MAMQAVENVAFTINAFANDVFGADGVDIDNDPLTVVTFTPASQGVVSYDGATGLFTYAPNPGAGSLSTSDSFTYTIRDGDGDTSTATVSITLRADSVPTVMVTDGTVDEKGLPARGLEPAGSGEIADSNATNNSDASETTTGSFAITTGGDTLSRLEVTDRFGALINVTGGGTVQGVNGTLTVTYNTMSGAYSWSYTLADNLLTHPNTTADATPGDRGAQDPVAGEAFLVTVTDSDNDIATDTLNITVLDDGPSAVNDMAMQAVENVAFTINAFANDVFGADGVDIDNDPLTVVTFTPASQGVVSYDGATGLFTYAPNPGAGSLSTSDSFTYTIRDGDGDTSTATVSITLRADSVPTVMVTDGTVDEKGLPARGLEPAGSGEIADSNATNNSDASETTTGSFAITTGGDTLSRLEVTDRFGALINVTGGGTVQGVNGTLTVTYNTMSGAYSWSYTLADNLLTHPNTTADATPGDRGAQDPVAGEAFLVTVTDSDNDIATDTLNITVLDDGPLAVAGSPVTISEAAGNTPQANLLTDDAQGADGATLTHVNFGSGFVAIGGGTFVVPNVGTYTFAANGSWSLDPADNPSNGTVDGSFTYRITDGDGDTSTALQTVNITNANNVPVGGNVIATVDDEGLRHGIAGNGTLVTGDAATNLSYATGTLTGNGGDGALNYTFANLNGVTGVTIGQETVSYGYASGRLTATITSVARSGSILFTVDLNEATGAYTFNLINPVRHAPGNSENGDISLALNYRVGDSDADMTAGDTALGTLTVTLDDDAPIPFTAQSMVIENGANSIGSGALNFYESIGADGGSVVFTGTEGSNLTSGVSTVTSGGRAVHLYGFGTGTLSGRIDLDGNAGNGDETTVFTATLSPNATDETLDTFTVQFLRALDDGSGTTITTSNFTDTSAQSFKVAEGAGNRDILLSARNNSGPASVNGSNSGGSVSFGVGNPAIGANELLRFDFADNVAVTNGNNNSFTYGNHYSVNGFTFTVEDGPSSVRVVAIDADNDTTLFGDAGDITDTITQIYQNGVLLNLGTLTASGGGYLVPTNDGDIISVFTSNGYNRIEVSHASGNTFSVSDVGFVSVNTGNDLPLSFNLTATDSDGDTASGTIAVTTTPLKTTIIGTANDDLIVSGIGGETINGSDGNDTLIGGVGADTLNGGNNTAAGDTVSYQNSALGVQVNLNTLTAQTSTGDASGDILSGIENLTGSALGDTLTGDGNANTLIGLAGADTLNGGGGNDILIGGLGVDTLTGGSGADTFRLTDTASADIITDFNQAQGDIIDLSFLITVAAGHNVSEYIQHSGTTLQVDLNGNVGGANFVTVATSLPNAPSPIAVVYEDAAHAQVTANF